MAVITDAKARNIKPEDAAIPHGGVTGLALHPSKTKGRGKWVLRYVSPVTNKRRNAGLGSYPEVGIAEVAKRATAMRVTLSEGKDPLMEKAQAEGAVKAPTFKEPLKSCTRTCYQDGKIPNMDSNGSIPLLNTSFPSWVQSCWEISSLPMSRMLSSLSGLRRLKLRAGSSKESIR